tara:strand:- start:9561 stop:10979 length:1419 start_codon:yes stop_codon:yes gene_type:complete
MVDDIAGATLTEVSAAIQRGDVSSVEVTRTCLERIEAQQSRINCFVSVRAESALVAAAEADAEISRGAWRGPLHGVPLAHKDMFYRAGEVTSFGSKICKDYVPSETSDVMASIDGAGAVDLGPLHMTEFAVGHTGAHEHLGFCRNPWNADRIPGGSSSGSGAAVAARLIYGSVASDTGGSCRLPASMCGVVGIKPTFGLVSRFGGMPRAWSLDVFGVYARTVEDAGVLLEVIAGESEQDPATYGTPRPTYDREPPTDLAGFKIGVPTDEAIFRADPAVQSVVDAALEELRLLGCEIVEIHLPDIDTIAALGGTILLAEAATIHDEWVREIPDQYAEAVVWRLQQGHHIPATRYLQAQRLRPRITKEFVTSVYDSVDAVLTPTITMPVLDFETANSFNSAEASGEIFETTKCTVWANYLGLPGMSVPCGFTPDGLPVGFQIVARPFDEAALLALGRGYQSRTSWHDRRPPETG